jgi:uncharacterized membrane protein/predicted DsbA family dithiol-disulfide isomerase
MLGAAALVASVVPAVTGLAASAVLAVDYRNPVPVFCAEGSGCDALKHTTLASFAGVPTPILGILGFLAVGVASLLPGSIARLAQLVVSVGGGTVGILLVFAQTVIGHYCAYCCVADASAVACAVVAGWRLARPRTEFPRPQAAWVAALALLAAGVLPFAIGSRRPGVPSVIQEEIARTPPGQVTIVDFVDFECPFCRMTQAALQPVLDEYRGRIRLVRRQVPLHIHAHAHDAARSACCGELLGMGDAMAEALFAAPVGELTPSGCENLAERIGLTLESYRACVIDPKTDARIEADRSEFKAAQGMALPTIWINGEPLVGAQRTDVLKMVVASALARTGG